MTLACPGDHPKHDYDRQPPCDQDFLRQFARDTEGERLQAWYNREVPRRLRNLRLCDAAGLFLGEACDLFVPDHER